MPNPETHTCPDCGFTWKHGLNGSHSCSTNLKTLLRAYVEDESRYLRGDRVSPQALILSKKGNPAVSCSRSHPHEPDAFCDGSIHHLIVQLQIRIAVLEDKLTIVQSQEVKLGQALEEIVAAHSLLKPETYHAYSLTKALEALGRA